MQIWNNCVLKQRLKFHLCMASCLVVQFWVPNRKVMLSQLEFRLECTDAINWTVKATDARWSSRVKRTVSSTRPPQRSTVTTERLL